MFFIFHLLALWLITLVSWAATTPDTVNSPLTSRGDNIEKNRQASLLLQWEYGGRLLLRAGDAMPLDGATDTLRIGALELGGEARLGPWMLHALALYEQQLTDPPQIDELFIRFQNGIPLYAQLGRQYAPFGNYDTAMINMPLTQYLGETRYEGLMGVWETDTTHLAGFTYPHQRLKDTWIWGANGGVQLGRLELNTSYMNHLNASDGFDGVLNATDTPAGVGFHAQWETDTLTLHGEWIGAVSTFKTQQLAWKNRGAQPQSWAVESRWQIVPIWHWALGYQGSAESVALGLPQQRWISTLSYQLRKNLQLAVELCQDEDYSTQNSGTGRVNRLINTQIALSF